MERIGVINGDGFGFRRVASVEAIAARQIRICWNFILGGEMGEWSMLMLNSKGNYHVCFCFYR